VNIFGRGFGNYDQDIVMRLTPRPQLRPDKKSPASKSEVLVHT